MTDLIERLRQHALPDPHDEREVLHAPLLRDAADEIERLRAHRDELLGAAQAVVDRWDSVLWARLPHTGEFIARLRTAIVKATKGES